MGSVNLNLSNLMDAYSQNLNETVNRANLNNAGRKISGGNNQISNVIDEENVKAADPVNTTHLQFEIHDKTGDIIVRVIDDNTQEVIREVPPEEIIDMILKFQEIDGVFIDEKR